MRADPDVFAEKDGRGDHVRAMGRILHVIEGGKHDLMPDQAPVPDDDAALVLETATLVDKHVLSHDDVLPEIGIKGREDMKALLFGLSRQGEKQLLQPFLRRAARVHLRGVLPCALRRAVHKKMFWRTRTDRSALFYISFIFFEFHALIIVSLPNHVKYLYCIVFHALQAWSTVI